MTELLYKDVIDTQNQENIRSDIFAVFQPNQIKSVDNRGAFDNNEDNIFKEGQKVYTEKDFSEPQQVIGRPICSSSERVLF